MKVWWYDGEDDRARAPAGAARWSLTIAWAVVVAAIAWGLILASTDGAAGRGVSSHVLVGMAPDTVFRVDACGAAGPVAGSDGLGIVEFRLPAGSCAGGGWVTVAPGAQGVRARCLVRER